MTPNGHANTVRDGLKWHSTTKEKHAARAALDALQAQAEAVEKRRIVTTTVQGDTHMNRLRERAEAAEADRDRLADALRRIVDALDHEGLGVVGSERLAIARAALAETEQP